ncbi:MAG: transcription termination factor NusA [Phycisphaerales bacterium]|nr:transcription termination factor NusA [Phycisphaerales bacterium]
MNQETIRIIDTISRERNIDRELLIGDLEQAMVSAARKHFNSLDTEEFGCEIEPISGALRLWRNNDDGTIEEIPIEELGRIPAQTAKQVMIQRFREDERASLFDEFSKRLGDVVTGTAHRYEGGALVVQVDRAEGFMPRSEQIPGEVFHPGDRVRCLIRDVREEGSRVKVVLSRSHPDFIRRLFEAEVPEVSEHIIEIKAMAREPGFRTKIAVSSIDSKVDAVGACVGVRGSRIRNIVDELGGEKIDIVRWNESSQVLISNALKPAEVEEVSLCFELGRATIIVRDDQLSLAIGRRGQNVRLAARLTGWDIDILTPNEFAKSLETLEQTVRTVEGVSDSMLDRMGALGIISVFDVEEVGVEVLLNEVEMSQAVADAVLVESAAMSKVVAEQQQKEKEEEERRRAEEAAAADALLASQTDAGAESAADSILGGGPVESIADSILGGGPVEPAADADTDAGSEDAEASTNEDSGETNTEETAESDSTPDVEPAREDS